jgi:2-polyprenyl-3-methyl-5-hydroxy-6-metoxy-1,4-benzoquinol methylase
MNKISDTTRIPELTPLMTSIKQCEAYNKYASNPITLHEYIQTYQSLIGIKQGTVIDLGSGTCNFVIALAQSFPNLNFVCYENSTAMIKIAKDNIISAGLTSKIQLIQDDVFNATGKYDVVLANRLLHHVNETEEFWKLINLLAENLLVIDINRPPKHVIDHMRENHEYQEDIHKEDLISSLQAAYSLQEVIEQIKEYDYTITADNNYKLFVYHTK